MVVAESKWGIKRICPSCSTRYYDFLKSPPTCPSCNSIYDPELLLKSRRARPVPSEMAPKKVPLQLRESLGVDVDEETVALEQGDDSALVADIIEVAPDDDDDLPEDVSELEGDDVEDGLIIEPDE